MSKYTPKKKTVFSLALKYKRDANDSVLNILHNTNKEVYL